LYHQEQWKSSTPGSKRRERSDLDDEEGGNSERRRRKGGKRRKKDKSSKSRYETEEAEADMRDDQEYPDDEDANLNYREPTSQNDQDEAEENVLDPLAAAGLEDSDAEDEEVILLLVFDFVVLIMSNFLNIYHSCDMSLWLETLRQDARQC
jgi:RNA polymerase-associated protein CTR9